MMNHHTPVEKANSGSHRADQATRFEYDARPKVYIDFRRPITADLHLKRTQQ